MERMIAKKMIVMIEERLQMSGLMERLQIKQPSKTNCLKTIFFFFDLKNFRPVSRLPLISKAIKKIFHDQTMTRLSENNVTDKFQSGFKKFHSRNSYLHDKITKAFESSVLTGMVLIDLQKTFDAIDHNISIKKCIFQVLLMRQSIGTQIESFSQYRKRVFG